MVRISFVILIVGIGLFPLALVFAHLDTALTNEIWEGPKYESIGKMTLNPGETYTFDFTVLDEPEISISMKLKPNDMHLTSQYFTHDGELIHERQLNDNTSNPLNVKSSFYPYAIFEFGQTYQGVFKNANDKPVEFDASIRTTETPPRPENYKIFQSLSMELFMLPIPVLVLGLIVFFAEWKYKKQVKQP